MRRKVLFEAEIDFIIPPKANRYLTAKNGKRFIPEKIREKIEDAVILFKALKKRQRINTISQTVKLEVLFVLSDKRKKDLDNMMKTLGDCLEKAQIIEDDNLIVKKVVEKVYSENKKEKTVIKIYPYAMRKV